MKKTLGVLLLLGCFLFESVFAQKYKSVNSTITFFSDAAIEDIAATVTSSSGILDLDTYHFAFSVPIRDFKFKKSLMKEHFNEKYMESERFPKATFTGTISGFADSALNTNVTAKGQLMIHGITRDVEIPATLKKDKSGYMIHSKFMVKLADHDIKIPQLLFQNIAEQVEVSVQFYLEPTN